VNENENENENDYLEEQIVVWRVFSVHKLLNDIHMVFEAFV